MMYEKNCEKCGVKMVSKTKIGRVKYCPACALDNKRKASRECMRKHYNKLTGGDKFERAIRQFSKKVLEQYHKSKCQDMSGLLSGVYKKSIAVLSAIIKEKEAKGRI